MVKLEIDVIHPNLYTMSNKLSEKIYFALQKKSEQDSGKGIKLGKVLRSIHEITEKYVGTLKVYKSDFEILKNGKAPEEETEEQVSLKEYLNLSEKKRKFIEFLTPESKVFNVGCFIDARTTTSKDLKNFEKKELYGAALYHYGENIDKFKELTGSDIDKKVFESRARENLEKTYAELPESIANFLLIKGEHPIFEETYLGVISLGYKEEVKSKIESAKSELVELLKKSGGPCLSYDTPDLINQMEKLHRDSSKIINKYGDILLDPKGWKKRLFRLDP